MPQSLRRKSCQACAKSKRRCDLNIPRCRRCHNTDRDCVYPWLPQPADVGLHRDTGAELVAVPFTPPGSATEYGTDFDTVTTESLWTTAGLEAETLQYDAFSQVQTIPRPMSPVMLSLLQDIVGQPGIPPPQPATFDSVLYDPATPLSLSISPSRTLLSSVAPPDKPNVSRSVFIQRTEYSARRMAAQASALAMDGRTTFIHHTQTATSAALREAMAASALHAVRNPSNAPIVRAEVARRAKSLVDAVEEARAHWSFVDMDMLQPVQALLIYQCIRLFSTADIAQQAQAERDGSHLRTWVDKLRESLLHDKSQSQSQVQSWESWIRCESIRRTVIFAELLWGIYFFLKYGWDDAHGRMNTLEFSAQTALWEAGTAAEWRAARGSSAVPPLHVKVARLKLDIVDARPRDVDDLSVAILAINTGLEGLEEWLAGDAAAVQKWGLRSDSNRPAAY